MTDFLSLYVQNKKRVYGDICIVFLCTVFILLLELLFLMLYYIEAIQISSLFSEKCRFNFLNLLLKYNLNFHFNGYFNINLPCIL